MHLQGTHFRRSSLLRALFSCSGRLLRDSRSSLLHHTVCAQAESSCTNAEKTSSTWQGGQLLWCAPWHTHASRWGLWQHRPAGGSAPGAHTASCLPAQHAGSNTWSSRIPGSLCSAVVPAGLTQQQEEPEGCPPPAPTQIIPPATTGTHLPNQHPPAQDPPRPAPTCCCERPPAARRSTHLQRSSTPIWERNWMSCSAVMSPEVKRASTPPTSCFSSATCCWKAALSASYLSLSRSNCWIRVLFSSLSDSAVASRAACCCCALLAAAASCAFSARRVEAEADRVWFSAESRWLTAASCAASCSVSVRWRCAARRSRWMSCGGGAGRRV